MNSAHGLIRGGDEERVRRGGRHVRESGTKERAKRTGVSGVKTRSAHMRVHCVPMKLRRGILRGFQISRVTPESGSEPSDRGGAAV